MDEKKNLIAEAYSEVSSVKDAMQKAREVADDTTLSDREKLRQLRQLVQGQYSTFKNYSEQREARKKAVAARLQQARKDCGLTQRDVAERIGVNMLTLSGYETGKSEVNIEVIVRLAKVYNVPTDYLLCVDDEL